MGGGRRTLILRIRKLEPEPLSLLCTSHVNNQISRQFKPPDLQSDPDPGFRLKIQGSGSSSSSDLKDGRTGGEKKRTDEDKVKSIHVYMCQ